MAYGATAMKFQGEAIRRAVPSMQGGAGENISPYNSPRVSPRQHPPSPSIGDIVRNHLIKHFPRPYKMFKKKYWSEKTVERLAFVGRMMIISAFCLFALAFCHHALIVGVCVRLAVLLLLGISLCVLAKKKTDPMTEASWTERMKWYTPYPWKRPVEKYEALAPGATHDKRGKPLASASNLSNRI